MKVFSFDKEYFERYFQQRSWFGFERGRRPFLYRYWLRVIRRLTGESDRVLEVGCGLGYFLRYLERARQAVGSDLSRDALLIAGQNLKSPLFQASAEDLPFKGGRFSLLVAFDVIEHLPHPEGFITEAQRVLEDNGHLILSAPNPSSFGARIKGRRPDLHHLPYEQRLHEWHAWRDDSHISIKPVEEWRRLLTGTGFRIVRDGTDTLWDVPYFKSIPCAVQKIFFISFHWVLTWLFGFFAWKWGENYVCIARKGVDSPKK